MVWSKLRFSTKSCHSWKFANDTIAAGFPGIGHGITSGPGNRDAASATESRKSALNGMEIPSLGRSFVGIAVHPLAHLDAFLASPLLSGNLAIEETHVAFGEGAYLGVRVI